MDHRMKLSREHFTHYSQLIGNPTLTAIPFLNQFLLSWFTLSLMSTIFYLSFSSLSYLYFFKVKKQKYTPYREQLRQYKENILFDIKWSFINIIFQPALLTLIKMAYPYYSKIEYEFQWRPTIILYLAFHLVYDEFFTYWIHRLLHYPILYKKIHWIHHESKSVTPFSGIAFHPLDAFAQAVPVFTSCFFIPIHINIVILHAALTSIWAFSIHDNVNLIPFKGILYAGSHTIHHFPWGQNYNYGKITSICDRIYGSYCDPEGITGYGYKTNSLVLSFCQKLNKIYVKIVPDFGREKIEKQSRSLYVKTRRNLENKIPNKSL